MSDEIKLNQALGRRARAEALLNNDLLQEAFKTLNDRYMQEWQITNFRDTDARERLWQAVNVLGKVKDHLTKVVQDGKLAQSEVDMLTERRRVSGL